MGLEGLMHNYYDLRNRYGEGNRFKYGGSKVSIGGAGQLRSKWIPRDLSSSGSMNEMEYHRA